MTAYFNCLTSSSCVALVIHKVCNGKARSWVLNSFLFGYCHMLREAADNCFSSVDDLLYDPASGIIRTRQFTYAIHHRLTSFDKIVFSNVKIQAIKVKCVVSMLFNPLTAISRQAAYQFCVTLYHEPVGRLERYMQIRTVSRRVGKNDTCRFGPSAGGPDIHIEKIENKILFVMISMVVL